MATMLFYQNPTPLDKKKHINLKLNRKVGYGFADKINSVPLAGFEFFEASRSSPVFFVKNADGNFVSVALISLRKTGHDMGENWENTYVPVYVRRYPFLMSNDGLVLIDEDAGHLGETDGEALFADQEGEASDLLKEVIGFLKTAEAGYTATEQFCTALKEKDMLVSFDRQLRVDGAGINLNDLYVIDEKKLAESLSDTEIVDWYKKGWIAWSYAQIHSVGSIHHVVKRAKDAGNPVIDPQEPAPAAAE
ncbi:MAG: hypothetical protein ACI93R_002608 [Flavobacteriales bacterium]|jgi:hypothetical protein